MQALTFHASSRSQQRGVPPLIREWLQDFGESQYDGHGGVVRFFSKKSVRALERNYGAAPVRRFHEFMRSYLVEASDSGVVLTIGKRYKSVHRP